jgi:alkylated DNA repair dioxygenase AlkB
VTKRQDCAAITLANGSLTIMENECQLRYVHCVPREQEVSEGRINLTV